MSEQTTAAAHVPRLSPDDIGEILRTFAESGWAGMRLDIGDVSIAVGKDAPPPDFVGSARAAGPVAATAPVPPLETSAAAPATTSAGATSAAAPKPARASSSASGAVSTTTASATDDIDETGLTSITSPTVGAFWVAPDPGSPPFVAVGDKVSAGDQLGIVEVMKLMNPIISDVAGEVVAIRASNADLVDFGQTLFLIRPDE